MSDINWEYFGFRLRIAMNEARLSCRAASKRVGIPPATVNRAMNGKEPSADHFIRLMLFMGFTDLREIWRFRAMTHETDGGKAAARTPERCSRCHRIFRVNEACNIFDGALVCFDCEPIKAAPAVAEPQGGEATDDVDYAALRDRLPQAVKDAGKMLHEDLSPAEAATPGEPDVLWDAECEEIAKRAMDEISDDAKARSLSGWIALYHRARNDRATLMAKLRSRGVRRHDHRGHGFGEA